MVYSFVLFFFLYNTVQLCSMGDSYQEDCLMRNSDMYDGKQKIGTFFWGFKYNLICKIGLKLWTFFVFPSNILFVLLLFLNDLFLAVSLPGTMKYIYRHVNLLHIYQNSFFQWITLFFFFLQTNHR